MTAVANELRGRYEGPDSPLRRIPGTQLDAVDGLVRNFAVQREAQRQLATEAGLLVVVAAALGILGSIWLSVYLRSTAVLREAEWRARENKLRTPRWIRRLTGTSVSNLASATKPALAILMAN